MKKSEDRLHDWPFKLNRDEVNLFLARSSSLVGDCREWKKAKTRKGYGRTSLALKNGLHRKFRAHRLSAFLSGLLLDIFNTETFVLHKCDNPACIMVEHLFIGTAKDNFLDMVSKNRQHIRRGEDANSKLTEEDILEIRKLKKMGLTQVTIGNMYSVHPVTVSKIHTRKKWKHVN